ncbi:acetate/propionate family kinase [Novipirellula artificiosorum]|uniref:Acetate kinase n=1 Tax=Novipirellula artificiosorum TaxID=2528016 RepID=A0A5C6DW92_9BACT|nr:acetate/propionate family kinase [Novipirellula artificiosorum]TWU40862.1 Acetate kinase [Novipirellula artificiosorum]
MNVLVFNVGSTTLKFACIDTTSGQRLSDGLVDRIGQSGGDAPDHLSAANLTLEKHAAINVDAIGHRVVHGSDFFTDCTLVTRKVLDDLATLDSLAPLHNPPARSVIQAITDRQMPIPQVMVFDTAYFATLPAKAYRYAVPEKIYRDFHVRRYGFHGTSHQYVAQRALEYLGGDPAAKRIITLHLGGGASAAASLGGSAVDVSLGMTPLEGLVMATRTGDIDASVPLHLMRQAGMSIDQVDRLLNKESGLIGLCGEADMRAILQRREQGDALATLAIDIYVHRLIKYVGAFAAVLGGLDALVFTAGVGENAAVIRELVARPLGFLGIAIDPETNQSARPKAEQIDLSASDATVCTLIVPTNEEWAIAKQTEAFVSQQHAVDAGLAVQGSP